LRQLSVLNRKPVWYSKYKYTSFWGEGGELFVYVASPRQHEQEDVPISENPEAWDIAGVADVAVAADASAAAAAAAATAGPLYAHMGQYL
jgi:hypothetical protein